MLDLADDGVRVRQRPSPFGGGADAVTYATPSCCCCCCCCLNTLSATIAFAAADADGMAEETEGGSSWGAVLTGLSPVLAIGAIVGFAYIGPGAAAVAGAVTLAIGLTIGYLIAGRRLWQGALRSIVVAALATAMVFVEIFATLVTFFFLQLAVPLSIWGGIALGRSLHERRRMIERTPFPQCPGATTPFGRPADPFGRPATPAPTDAEGRPLGPPLGPGSPLPPPPGFDGDPPGRPSSPW